MKTTLSNVLTQNDIDETWQGRTKNRSTKKRCDEGVLEENGRGSIWTVHIN